MRQLLLTGTMVLAFAACDSAPNRVKMNGGSADSGGGTGGSGGGGGGGIIDNAMDTEIKLDPSVAHRLNKYEYNSAIQDLVEMDITPADEFPSDPSTHGFDNVATNLTLTPALTDQFNQASEKISKIAMSDHPRSQVKINLLEFGNANSGNSMGEAWNIVGTLTVKFTLLQDESMSFDVQMASKALGAATPRTTLTLDGKVLGSYEIKGIGDNPDTLKFQAELTKGEHSLSMSFDNRVLPEPQRNVFNTLVVNSVSGVSKEMAVTPLSKKLSACATSPAKETCITDLYLGFAQRAWRRLLTVEEKSELSTLWKSIIAAKGTDQDAMKGIIHAVTLSSKFLFRTVNPASEGESSVGPIDDMSLASRLSFFLWSSVPDDELLRAAANKELQDPAKLKGQLQRMLADPKAQRFTRGFASQWLFTRLLTKSKPDPNVFKGFDEDLKKAMTMESEMVFADFLTNGKPINDFLAPGFTFANDRLAKHYGLKEPGSAVPMKVPTDTTRGGILSHAGWLTVTSLPTDTMPVKRGAWVMENILCMNVPIPPPVPALDNVEVGEAKLSVRERFALHLNNKTCAACHNLIDPIGFGLEAYDGVGAFRSLDSTGKPVDTKGKLMKDEFSDAEGLVKILQSGRDFEHCLTKKLYSYALGKSAGSTDKKFIEDIEKAAEAQGSTLDSIVEGIVLSPAFRLADFSEDL